MALSTTITVDDSITMVVDVHSGIQGATGETGPAGADGSEWEVKSTSFTAASNGMYVATATLTVTDPTPAQGLIFQVLVRNGTATIGGTAYAVAGTIIRRVYHSGAWASYVSEAVSGLGTAAYANIGTGDGQVPQFSSNAALAVESMAIGGITETGAKFTFPSLSFSPEIQFLNPGGTPQVHFVNWDSVYFNSANCIFETAVTFNSTTYTFGTGAAAAFRTALGSGTTGDALYTAATAAAARSILGEQLKSSTGTTSVTDATTYVDVTGLTGYTLEAGGLYQLILFSSNATCSASTGLRIRFLASVDLLGGGNSNGIYPRNAGNNVQTIAMSPTTDDLILLSETAINTNTSAFSLAVFAVGGSAGTGKIQIRNNSAGTGTFSLADAHCLLRKIN